MMFIFGAHGGEQSSNPVSIYAAAAEQCIIILHHVLESYQVWIYRYV